MLQWCAPCLTPGEPRGTLPETAKQNKLSQQRTLTEGGLEFKAANQCSDRLDPFKKLPDVYSVRFCFFPVAFAGS